MPAPPPLASKFMGMASYAPTCFLDLMDDDGESDGSSISDMAPSHRPSRECAMVDAPGHPPVEAESSQTHTSPDSHAETPELTRDTARHYDNSGCISHRLRQHARRTTLRPVHIDQRAPPGVAPVGSSATP